MSTPFVGMGVQYLYMILTLLCIAFFVAAKFSFTRIRRVHHEDLGLKERDKEILEACNAKPQLHLVTLQGILVFFSVCLGLLAWPITEQFTLWWEMEVGLSSHMSYLLGCGMVILAVTMIALALGEVVPKALALSFPVATFSFTAKYTRIFTFVMRPIGALVLGFARLLLRNSEAKVMTELDLVHSEEEIRTIVTHSHMGGGIDKVESELIENVFDFVDRMAKEVMIPRQDVECLYADESYEENRHIIVTSKHTRYPLCEGDKDHIIGLIHVKDFLEREEEAKKDLRLIKRKILIVPEVMKLSVLLQHMRAQRTYQSIVVDEYGGMVGLVGLEDVVEELVGDIKDEHEEAKDQIVALDQGGYDFDGATLVDDVEDTLGVTLDDCEEDTLGGYIFSLLGQTPEENDHVVTSGYAFRVTEMQGYRITRVEARPIPEETKAEAEAAHEG